jgi:putative endonuclease
MWSIYILLCSDGSFYAGSTNDIEKRLRAHFAGKGAKYTKSHKPVKIIYREEFNTKPKALKREIEIKRLTRKEKEKLIKDFRKEQESSNHTGCN